MPLLELRSLDLFFRTGGGEIAVVNDLSFSIEQGAFFGLAGESGSGKSLTALSIMGILPQGARAGGRIEFKGEDLLTLPPERMRRLRGKEISMIFQEPMTSLNPVLRVGYQVEEAILAHLPVSKKEARGMAVELLRQMKIPEPELRVRDYPHQLSGGMRQRVMIAMAIACGPSLLIADEPTTALDVTIEAQILELIDTLRAEKNMAVLLITHDLGAIAENAQTVGVMYAGRLVELSPVGAIFNDPRHPYTIGLLESIPGKRDAALKPIPGAVPPPGALPPGCKFSDRCFFVIPGCRAAEPALREILPRHFARCIRAEELDWKKTSS